MEHPSSPLSGDAHRGGNTGVSTPLVPHLSGLMMDPILFALIVALAFFAPAVKIWYKSIHTYLTEHGYWTRFEEVSKIIEKQS